MEYINNEFIQHVSPMLKIASEVQDNLVQLFIHSFTFFGRLDKLIINKR